MVVTGDAPCDVIFVVEQTAQNGAYIQDLKTNYIVPTLEFFTQNVMDEKCGTTRFGIVTYKTAQGLCSSVSTFGPFNRGESVMETFERIDFTGGKSEANACLAEGLATALVCFQDLEQTKEHTFATNKFCILICHSAPYLMPVMECFTYENKTAEQLATIFQENNINLSIISPRKIPVFFKLFEKAGGDISATSKNYCKDVRHLVLLKGFQLSERAPSPSSNVANNVQNNVSVPSNQNVETPLQNQPAPQPTVQPNVCAQDVQQMQQPTQQQMINAQMAAQMRSQMPPQQNPQMMRPMMNPMNQGPPMGMTQQQQAMMAQQQQAMAAVAARQQNPQRWPRPGQQFMGQPFNPQQNQGPQMMNQQQQNSALQQQLQQNTPQAQQLRMQLMNQQGAPPNQVQNPQVMNSQVMNQPGMQQPGMQQPGVQQAPNPMQQMPNQMQPNQQNPQQQQQPQQMQQQQQQQQMQPNQQQQQQQQVPPAGPSMQGQIPGQQQPVQQPNAQRQRIWSGTVEWMEKTNKNDQTKITRQAPFQVTATVKDGEPEIKADHWPQRLLMQLMPKQMVGSAGGQYLKESKTVVFHPTPCDALESLSKIMGSGMAGCVHFNISSQCEIIVLILLYSAEKKAFLGFIPNDQTGFVDRLKKVIVQNKMATTLQGAQGNQQQIMPPVSQAPNQMGPIPGQGVPRMPGGMGMPQQMDPNEQQWQMNQQAMANQQQVMQNQQQQQMMQGNPMGGNPQQQMNPGMVNAQQRMVRPMMPNNPGLRHLLQQQQQPMRMGMRPPTQGGPGQYDEQNYDFM